MQAARSAFALVASLDPEFIGIVGLSLGVSLSASVIAMVIGAPFGGDASAPHAPAVTPQ